MEFEMFVITVKFTTNPEDTKKFKKRMIQQARDSLNLENDCIVFDICHDPVNEDVVFLYEIYKDEAAFKVHLNSKHYLSFNEEVTPWVLEKIVSKLQKQIISFKKIIFTSNRMTPRDSLKDRPILNAQMKNKWLSKKIYEGDRF